MNLNLNDASSALCDIYDIKRALSKKIKSQPKDNEGTDITIGDCIDDLVLFLEGIGYVLQENEAQDDVLVLRRVHVGAQSIRRLPE